MIFTLIQVSRFLSELFRYVDKHNNTVQGCQNHPALSHNTVHQGHAQNGTNIPTSSKNPYFSQSWFVGEKLLV